jgi:hypothetical protein
MKQLTMLHFPSTKHPKLPALRIQQVLRDLVEYLVCMQVKVLEREGNRTQKRGIIWEIFIYIKF